MSYFIYADAAESQENGSVTSIVAKIRERNTARPEPAPAKPKRKRSPKRRQRPAPDRQLLAARLADLAHQYDKPARIVIETESLSIGATAVYWFMDSRCFDGVQVRRKAESRLPEWVKPPRSDLIIGLTEIAERFALSEDVIHQYIDELRAHGFVYRHHRGQNKWNSYELVPRKKRLEHDAELHAMIRAAIPKI